MRRVCGVWLIAAACSSGPDATARVTLAATNTEAIAGEGTFTLDDGTVAFELVMTAGPKGGHGLVLHEGPACATPGATWDVLGAVDINSNGDGMFTLTRPAWTLGDGAPTDVAPRVLILYDAGPGTPTLGCGTIALDP